MGRITGAELVCKALKLEGVKNIFALAGDHILPVLDVMADQDFHIIDTRHEQAAVHMADAWVESRSSRVSVCTLLRASPTQFPV